MMHRYSVLIPSQPLIALCAVPFLLSACGGGGGGGTSPTDSYTPPPTQSSPAVPRDFLSDYFIADLAPYSAAAAHLRENENQYTYQNIYWYADLNSNGQRDTGAERLFNTYPLASSRIDYAHATGLRGTDQTIAIIDDGFYTSHEFFSTTPYVTATSVRATSHGTGVASIISADTDRMIGVAPDATLILGSYDTAATRLATVQAARDHNAVAINNSWGFVVDASTTNYQSLIASDNGNFIEALSDYAQTGVVVFAAANDIDRTQSTLMESLPAFDPRLKDGWIAVVSGIPDYDDTGITSVTLRSTGCFEAAQWCIVGDGSWRSATASGPTGYAFSTGTSFAAPMVTGSMALLAEAFPDLTPHQLRVRLLASADNSFTEFTSDGEVELAEGFSRPYSDTYGLGFLDTAAALLPIGDASTTLSNGQDYSVTGPVIQSASTTGNAIKRALQGDTILIEDAFDGRFTLPTAALVSTAQAPSALDRWTDQARALSAAQWSSVGALAQGGTSHHLSLGTGHVALWSDDTQHTNHGLSIGQTLEFDKTRITVSLGHLMDQGSLLPSDYIGTKSALTSIGFKAEHSLSERSLLTLSGQLAYAPQTELAAIGHRSDTVLTQVSASMHHFGVLNEHDRLRIGLHAPLGVQSGRITLPVLQTNAAGETRSVEANLAPSAREFDISLSYDTRLSDHSVLSLGLIHAVNHGHQSGATDTAALVSFGLKF